eukprot:jgi/Mesvir1/27844/Mv07519-RA.1
MGGKAYGERKNGGGRARGSKQCAGSKSEGASGLHIKLSGFADGQKFEDKETNCVDRWEIQTADRIEFTLADGRTVSLEQRPHDAEYGSQLWEGAIVLTKILETLPANALHGAKVVELGSGLGLVGITASLLNAVAVITELPQCLPLLQRNVDANCAGKSAIVQELTWKDVGFHFDEDSVADTPAILSSVDPSPLGSASSCGVPSSLSNPSPALVQPSLGNRPDPCGASNHAGSDNAGAGHPLPPSSHVLDVLPVEVRSLSPLDFILVADCVYEERLVRPLVSTLVALCWHSRLAYARASAARARASGAEQETRKKAGGQGGVAKASAHGAGRASASGTVRAGKAKGADAGGHGEGSENMSCVEVASGSSHAHGAGGGTLRHAASITSHSDNPSQMGVARDASHADASGADVSGADVMRRGQGAIVTSREASACEALPVTSPSTDAAAPQGEAAGAAAARRAREGARAAAASVVSASIMKGTRASIIEGGRASVNEGAASALEFIDGDGRHPLAENRASKGNQYDSGPSGLTPRQHEDGANGGEAVEAEARDEVGVIPEGSLPPGPTPGRVMPPDTDASIQRRVAKARREGSKGKVSRPSNPLDGPCIIFVCEKRAGAVFNLLMDTAAEAGFVVVPIILAEADIPAELVKEHMYAFRFVPTFK